MGQAEDNYYSGSMLASMVKFFEGEVRHRLWQMAEIGLLPDTLVWIGSFFSSVMGGDLLISPALYISDMKYFLQNPTVDFIRYCIGKGERAVWKHLTHVKMRCAVEFTIEDILEKQQLKKPEPLAMQRFSLQK